MKYRNPSYGVLFSAMPQPSLSFSNLDDHLGEGAFLLYPHTHWLSCLSVILPWDVPCTLGWPVSREVSVDPVYCDYILHTPPILLQRFPSEIFLSGEQKDMRLDEASRVEHTQALPAFPC